MLHFNIHLTGNHLIWILVIISTFYNIIVIAIFLAVGVPLLAKFTNVYAQSSNYEFDRQYVFPKVNLTHYDLNTVNITMSRGLCLGTCPAYYLEIHGDGKVIYRGHLYVRVTGEQTSHIAPEKVRELVKWFNDSD